MTEECKDCQWFKIHDISDLGKGSCHRYPPTVQVTPMGVSVVFPIVERDNFCGEFKTKLTVN